RQLVELPGVCGDQLGPVGGRLLPLAVHQALDPHGAGRVQPGARRIRVEEAVVLAPLLARLVPGGPQAAAAVTPQAGAGAKQRRVLRGQPVAQRRPRPSGDGTDADAVAPRLVGVPADPDAVLLRVGGDGRVPVVGGAGADPDGVVPAVAVRAAGEDVSLAV